MQRKKQPKIFRRLDYMHEWVELARRPAGASGDPKSPAVADDFFDIEKQLYGFGLHTKIVAEDNGDTVLYARKRDAEYARALIDGEVAHIVTDGIPEFQLINDDFTFKNEKFLQDNSRSELLRKRTRRTLMMFALLLCLAAAMAFYFSFR